MGIIDIFKKNNMEFLLNQLRNSDERIQRETMKKLKKINLKVDEGLKILEASKSEFPPAKYESQNIPAELIDLCIKNPYSEYINKMENIYPDLNSEAKISVLHFLATSESPQALITYLKLLKLDYEALKRLPTGTLGDNPRFPEILFPNLLEYASNKEISSKIYLLLLDYLGKGLITETSLVKYKNIIVSDIIDMAQKIISYKWDPEHRSIWDDDNYIELRYHAGIHFDLAGYIRDPRIICALKNLMNQKDKKLKMFSLLSLIRQDQPVKDEDLLEVAADSESRNIFFDILMKIGKPDLYPKKYLNQRSFAESNMVDWLIFPTELGRVPDEIELMNIIEDDDEEFYLFRFRCNDANWQEEGWMAGVSGSFIKKEKPTTNAQGYTFSCFDKWESKSPEEHFEVIVDSIKKYWIKKVEDISNEDT